MRSTLKRIYSFVLAGKLPVAGFLVASIFGYEGFAQDTPAALTATTSASSAASTPDSLSLTIFIAIAAVLLALWAIFEGGRSRRRLKTLEQSYYNKEYIGEAVSSEQFFSTMRSCFVPNNVGRDASGEKLSAAEFGDIARLRADLEELKKKFDPATKSRPGPAPAEHAAVTLETVKTNGVLALEGVSAAGRAKRGVKVPATIQPKEKIISKVSSRIVSEPLELLSKELAKKNGAGGKEAIPKAKAPEGADKQPRAKGGATEPAISAISEELSSEPSRPLPQPSVRFAPWPGEDGTFEISDEQEEYGSLFKLTMDGPAETATSAKVELCDNPDRIKSVIPNHSLYLAPVCSYEQNPPKNARRIIVKQPGRAERKGPDQIWRIKDKLHIEFR